MPAFQRVFVLPIPPAGNAPFVPLLLSRFEQRTGHKPDYLALMDMPDPARHSLQEVLPSEWREFRPSVIAQKGLHSFAVNETRSHPPSLMEL